jgi:hypothetical protein
VEQLNDAKLMCRNLRDTCGRVWYSVPAAECIPPVDSGVIVFRLIPITVGRELAARGPRLRYK